MSRAAEILSVHVIEALEEESSYAAMPILDRELVDELCRLSPLCSPGFLDSLATEFAQSAQESLRALRAAVHARDSDGVAYAAHRLLGASGAVGAVRVSRACSALEAQPTASYCMSVLGVLQTAVKDALRSLRTRFAIFQQQRGTSALTCH